MLVQEPLQAAIWHCLNHYAYVDASFLAERLLAEVDSEEALHLLATTYYRSGKISRAYSVLRMHGHSSPQLKYLLAKCCFDLGKYDEAETTLTGGSVLRQKQIDEMVTEYGSLACFALQLLGLICAKTERMIKASEALKRSLKLNPFLWSSFALLCDYGDKPDPSKIFKVDSLDNFSNSHGNTVCSIFNNVENSSLCLHHDSLVNSNKLTQVSMNTPIENVHHSSPQLINHSQNIHNQQTQVLSSHNLPVPKIPLTMPNNATFISTPIQPSLAGLNTPLSVNSLVPESLDSFDVPKKKMVKFHRLLGPYSSLSPISPSFGVLPLDISQLSTDTENSNNSSIGVLTPNSFALMQRDSQANHKININAGKRILCRNVTKETPTLVINKPTVFAPTSNNNNYQNSPTGQAYVRRSSRLFGNSNSVKENNKNRFVAPKSPARKTKSRTSKSQSSLNELNEKNKSENHDIISIEKSLADKPCVTPQNLSQQALSIQKQCAEGLMNLLKNIGLAYVELSQYNCKKAVELFESLPSHHYKTSWVLSHLARTYFEMNDYESAEKYFTEVREKDPNSLYFMDLFSTALWHLQKDVPLSALAQDMVEVDRDAPQAWCAAGNCFSLQKEHEAAIKLFSRAIQVNPEFPYAYTLLGHEYLATEELDKALSCYRTASRLEPRHYNAWYGIGLVLFKQERFGQAEWYFKKAVSIHPQCSVLLCHVAVVEHTLSKSINALETLSKALSIEPRNPLCKYHRASILHALDRHSEALQELLQLKEIVPKESNVYFLLGKVYKRLGDTHLALMNFSWALDLDPKDANNQFKETIDPAINCFPSEDEDNSNNNPQENVNNGSNASSMIADSSRESFVLEAASSEANFISPISDPPAVSAAILNPHAPPIPAAAPAPRLSLHHSALGSSPSLDQEAPPQHFIR